MGGSREGGRLRKTGQQASRPHLQQPGPPLVVSQPAQRATTPRCTAGATPKREPSGPVESRLMPAPARTERVPDNGLFSRTSCPSRGGRRHDGTACWRRLNLRRVTPSSYPVPHPGACPSRGPSRSASRCHSWFSQVEPGSERTRASSSLSTATPWARTEDFLLGGDHGEGVDGRHLSDAHPAGARWSTTRSRCSSAKVTAERGAFAKTGPGLTPPRAGGRPAPANPPALRRWWARTRGR